MAIEIDEGGLSSGRGHSAVFVQLRALAGSDGMVPPGRWIAVRAGGSGAVERRMLGRVLRLAEGAGPSALRLIFADDRLPESVVVTERADEDAEDAWILC